MEPAALEGFFAPFVAVRTRRMFGGIGIYADEAMFALWVGGRHYLKTNDETRALFAQAGCEPFRFATRGVMRETSYWSLPAEAMNDPDALAGWVALARKASAQAGAAKLRRRGSPARPLPR